MAAEQEKLSAAQRSKIRRLSEPKELTADEEGGELNVVPFLDIVMNVLIFVLATVSINFISLIDMQPPRANENAVSRPEEQQALQLTLIIGDNGIIVSGEGRKFAPGCDEKVAGDMKDPTIGLVQDPKTGNVMGPDFKALTDCVTKLKKRNGSYATERQATLTADFKIPYQTIISTMDAIRGAPPTKKPPPATDDECNVNNGCLFDQVVFSVVGNK